MSAAKAFVALARAIDAERAEALVRELGTRAERAGAVLLGTAFPPLTPGSAQQLASLEALMGEGLRVSRRRGDLLRDARMVVANASSGQLFLQRLRRFVWAERARIALRELLPVELGGARIDVTARELSWLADVALQLTLEEAAEQVSARFGPALKSSGETATLAAFGLGKLGGAELNAGSDIDLVFVYDTDDGGSQLSLHDHFSRVVQRAVASLDDASADGRIWKVDLRLRPEGSAGAIVNSVAATERYYETWGRLWERAALLRARPAAGDARLGTLVLREIFTPFVYRHAVDPSLGLALAELVERSRRELSPDPARDLKLGPGGIREAEFFVQTLQLVWGGREPSLRVSGTLQALSRLRSRGLVSDREARRIGEGYAFLRRVEHRIQWTQGIQTHLVPAGRAELARLGRTLGYSDERPLAEELRRVRESISRLFARLSPRERPQRKEARFQTLLSAVHEREQAAVEAERAFGSYEVGEHLFALAKRPDGLFGELTRDRFPALAGEVLEALAASPDAEQATLYLRSFFARFLSPDTYVTALADDTRALARFVTVLGASRFVGDALVSRPDLADVVLFGGGAVSDPTAAIALEVETHRAALGAAADDADEEEGFVTALRIAKRRVTVEVAVADLAGSIGTREATRLLSTLADGIVQRAVERVVRRGASGLAVIALGKLGGCDIGYGSDLDVIFVFEPGAAVTVAEASSRFTRAAQRVIWLLSEPSAAGPGYELDTRLRPSGSQGLLVTSLAAFARYHGLAGTETEGPGPRTSAAAWERQALIRARFCAGDPEVGRRVLQLAEAAAYDGGAPPLEEMHRLRLRLERELGREHALRHDLKTGRGGLLDIEFCVQWLQMQHGHDRRLRTSDTAEALDALHELGILERTHFEVLRAGQHFLRRLEQRIHILGGVGSSVIAAERRGMAQLARRMGFQDDPQHSAPQQLLAHYADVTSSVRRAYLSVLGLADA